MPSGNIDDEQLYTLRNFQKKGSKVINRGDSVKSRSRTSLNSRKSRWSVASSSIFNLYVEWRGKFNLEGWPKIKHLIFSSCLKGLNNFNFCKCRYYSVTYQLWSYMMSDIWLMHVFERTDNLTFMQVINGVWNSNYIASDGLFTVSSLSRGSRLRRSCWAEGGLLQ